MRKERNRQPDPNYVAPTLAREKARETLLRRAENQSTGRDEELLLRNSQCPLASKVEIQVADGQEQGVSLPPVKW